jgi:LPXTG-site transpeptidase (sortase) family protein
MNRTVALAGLLALAVGAFLLASPPTAPRAGADVTAIPPVSASASATPPAIAPSGTVHPTSTPLPPIPVGYRVQIPRLAIDLAILEGDVARDTVQQQTPENYAFHLPGTAIPGAGLNSYIYAHARRGMFLSLWDARVGDVVWISTPDGRALRYAIAEIHPRVAPNDMSWVESSAPERLTLQTSTGPNASDPRFVVVARP